MRFSQTAPVRVVPSEDAWLQREFTGERIFHFEFGPGDDEAIAILDRAWREVANLVPTAED